MKTDKLWKSILEKTQPHISAASFNSWILPLTVVSAEETEKTIAITLSCPSSFHKSLIERRFASHIRQAGERVTDKVVELGYSIDTSLGQETTTSMGPLFQQQKDQMEALSLAIHRVGLREDFTFENFAVSSSNEMAHAAASAVADNFGAAYNPLFLYGGVGVGKTHLSQAVAIRALKQDPDSKLIFCMSEEFTNGIIEAIQQKKTQAFRKRYREVRGLFIDDIQFIAGKTTVQEEFFHTFNAILKAGGQVVMTSDRPPNEIRDLEARLRSRFEAGLLVDIGRPDFELRTAITLIKAQQRQMELSMEDAQTIAANIESARKIEGFLTRLTTEAQLRKRPINDSLIQALLGKANLQKDDAPPPLRPLEVMRGVAGYFDIPTKELKGKRRQKQFVKPRHLAMYLLRIDYKLPLAEIGMLFSDRDHTTVMHAVEKISKQLKDRESLRLDLNEVRKQLYT